MASYNDKRSQWRLFGPAGWPRMRILAFGNDYEHIGVWTDGYSAHVMMPLNAWGVWFLGGGQGMREFKLHSLGMGIRSFTTGFADCK